MLRQSIEQEWNPKLVHLYGMLTDVNHSKQLDIAERWLNKHKDDAVLLLTLGRLSSHKQLWGKARNYFEASININPTPEAYYALATLLEKINEKEKATECYRKGLTLASQSQQYAAA
jgi:HemY protein